MEHKKALDDVFESDALLGQFFDGLENVSF